MARTLLCLMCAALMLGCGDDRISSPLEEPLEPAMSFSPESLSLAAGAEGSVSLLLRDFARPFFGLSLQIEYDDSIISFADPTGFAAGALFGADAVVFVAEHDSRIHMTFTRIRGRGDVSGSGTLCALTFTGLSAGTSSVRILADELRFYDANGEGIDMPEIRFTTASIIVR